MIAPPPRTMAAEPVAQPSHGASAGAPVSAARMMVAPRPIAPPHPPDPRPSRPRPPTDPVRPPPRPTTGPRILAALTRVEGGLSRAAAQRTMPMIEARVAQCFQSASASNPSVQGLMVIRLGVANDGRVSQFTEAANYVRDANLSQCLASAFRTVQFSGYTGTPATALVQLRFMQR